MEYPTLVYTCPGFHSCNKGTYDFIQVSNEEELNNRLAEGYKLTLVEAMGQETPIENKVEVKPINKRNRHGMQKEI